jgi:hypothetical protein
LVPHLDPEGEVAPDVVQVRIGQLPKQAPETIAAAQKAQLLIERAEALNEPIEDPLLLLSALNGSWLATLKICNCESATVRINHPPDWGIDLPPLSVKPFSGA